MRIALGSPGRQPIASSAKWPDSMTAMSAAASGEGEATIGFSLRRRLVGFVRTLRDNGFHVGLAESRDGLRVLASPAALQPRSLQSALRSLFCATRSDWQRFDGIFEAYWLRRFLRSVERTSAAPSRSRASLERLFRDGAAQGPTGAPDHVERRAAADGEELADGRGRREGASRAEMLESIDLRHIVDPDDIAAAHQLAERLARKMRAKLVRLVILLDASGSMSLYTAFFVRFLHGVVDAFREAEAFIFHTRLAHVSQSLRDRDAARAVDRLALMAEGIGGGTRIGESLATFNRWHAARVIHSRTAIMIVSDGYDTGEPERLAVEMRRLSRRCRRIIWLNPLIGWEGYAPEARAMQAALPYVDLFAPAHSLDSLAALEPYLARI